MIPQTGVFLIGADLLWLRLSLPTVTIKMPLSVALTAHD